MKRKVKVLLDGLQSATPLEEAIDKIRGIKQLVEQPDEKKRREATAAVLESDGIQIILASVEKCFAEAARLTPARTSNSVSNLMRQFPVQATIKPKRYVKIWLDELKEANTLEAKEAPMYDLRSIVSSYEDGDQTDEDMQVEAISAVVELGGVETILSSVEDPFAADEQFDDALEQLDDIYSSLLLSLATLTAGNDEAKVQFFKFGGLQKVFKAARTRSTSNRAVLCRFGYDLIKILANCACDKDAVAVVETQAGDYITKTIKMWEAAVTEQFVALVLETMSTWPASSGTQHFACLYFLRISEVADGPTRERVLTNRIVEPLRAAGVILREHRVNLVFVEAIVRLSQKVDEILKSDEVENTAMSVERSH